ncbi:MAG: DUF58 domain-containing protein [Acidobacteria bacterium]|nr:DUF58 domain-containing protein [Acidobacteriota bacterium]
MIPIPTRRLLRILLTWTILGLVVSVVPRFVPIWRGMGWALGAAVLVDACLALWPKPMEGTREVRPSLALGAWKPVKLRFTNGSRISWAFTVMDHHPVDFEVRGQGQGHRVPAGGFLELTYQVRPTARGRRAFEPAQLRLEGPLGLIARDLRLAGTTAVKVFPDFATVARYALLAIDNRLSALGILRRPRRGEGMDFQQLREYRTGDSLRRIDWKATARSQKLISREYQDERDQQVLFLLDCGRRMRALDDLDNFPSGSEAWAPPGPPMAAPPTRIGHFDQALNALFLLSFVALKQGDAVGVATFAEAQPRLLAPRKGLVALDHLFQNLFDLEPSTRATDYLEAARSLRTRLRKRSLIVLLTNLRDEEEETLAPALQLLRHKHLVLVANLREAAVDRLLEQVPGTFPEALTQAAALDWQARREAALRAVAHQGAQVLDVKPEALPTALVNRYLELKTSGVF